MARTHIKTTPHARHALRNGLVRAACPAGTSGCSPALPRALVGAAICPSCGRRGDTRGIGR